MTKHLSLELSKKLVEAGIELETEAVYCVGPDGRYLYGGKEDLTTQGYPPKWFVPVPDIPELLERLEANCTRIEIEILDEGYEVRADLFDKVANTELPDALGGLLLKVE